MTETNLQETEQHTNGAAVELSTVRLNKKMVLEMLTKAEQAIIQGNFLTAQVHVQAAKSMVSVSSEITN